MLCAEDETMTAITQEERFDTARAEAFAGKLTEILEGGGLAIALSVGHKTGLFDALATLPPSTSSEIAQKAGLVERYVREWLSAMVTGGIIEYEPATQRFWLPAEHAQFTTRAAGVDNMAFFAQYIAVLGSVEDPVVEAFRHGGGVPYEGFPAFQKIQAEETARVFDAALISSILPLQDGLIQALRLGIDVADIGCGAGHAINVMAEAFPRSRFTGYDFSAEGIATGRAEARRMKLENVRFEQRDVATLDAVSAYDLITAFDAIHDQVHPRRVLRNIRHALRDGGTFLMADIAGSSDLEKNIGKPLAPLLYTLSMNHCMTVSLAHDGEGLGTMWGQEKALELLGEAGFEDVAVKQVEGDVLNVYYVMVK
jgi:SAM-dependent methyltransferase